MGSEGMNRFLKRLLKTYRFEEMRIPLGVLATDLSSGKSVPLPETGQYSTPSALVAPIPVCFSR